MRDGYDNLIRELFAVPLQKEPVSLPLSDEAITLFREWHDIHCKESEQQSLPPFLRAAYAKLKGYCPRLALIHALATNPATERVERVSVEAAIQLVNYFKVQARKVMPLIGQNKSSEVERCKAEIRRKLSVSRSMKKRDIQKSSAFDAAVFNEAFTEMTAPQLVVDAEGGVRLWEPTNRQMTS